LDEFLACAERQEYFLKRACHIRAAKKPDLAARKITEPPCLQFAARLIDRVNVGALRESQTEIKRLTRRRISCRTTPGLTRALTSNASQAIEQSC
jgi:hypothetical protein